MTNEPKTRYSLVLPTIMFDEIRAIADERHSTIVEVIKQYVRLGLMVSKGELDLVSKKEGREYTLELL